jgi:predicted phosphohydrolase
MKLVLISDTHCHHQELSIPEGDVLVCAGDFCNYGREKEARSFLKWMDALPHRYKLLTAGNHDFPFQKEASRSELLRLAPSITYLQDSGTTINGINFWGSPYTPMFCKDRKSVV